MVGKSLEGDNYYGINNECAYQCVDFIICYYKYLGVSPSSGNGCEYSTNNLPQGWQRVQGGKPEKGDILVYSGNSLNPAGHVAIYESDYSTYHQNFNNCRKVTHETYKYDKLDNDYWGYIRPDWTGVSTNIQLWGINNGDTFTGKAKLWAKRRDSDANHFAVFYMDGQAISGHLSSDNSGYFSIEINTAIYSNGNHTFGVEYTNSNGCYKDERTITVSNSANIDKDEKGIESEEEEITEEAMAEQIEQAVFNGSENNKYSNSDVKWKSNNRRVVTVSSSGKIKASKKGVAVITANIGEVNRSVKVLVSKPTIKVKKGGKVVTSVILKKGKSKELKIVTTPSSAKIKVSFKRKSEKRFANVMVTSKKIKIKGKKRGKVNLRLSCGTVSQIIKVKII